jgi:hypothetical protein
MTMTTLGFPVLAGPRCLILVREMFNAARVVTTELWQAHSSLFDTHGAVSAALYIASDLTSVGIGRDVEPVQGFDMAVCRPQSLIWRNSIVRSQVAKKLRAASNKRAAQSWLFCVMDDFPVTRMWPLHYDLIPAGVHHSCNRQWPASP